MEENSIRPPKDEQYIGDIVIGPNGRTIPVYTDAGLSPAEQAAVLSLTKKVIDDAAEQARKVVFR
jgi:hypothetical protein